VQNIAVLLQGAKLQGYVQARANAAETYTRRTQYRDGTSFGAPLAMFEILPIPRRESTILKANP
jgi:hypothetical protein